MKNVLLTPEKTLARKIREALLARRIEQELTKEEILELYLNHIYFGHGRYRRRGGRALLLSATASPTSRSRRPPCSPPS